MIVTENIRLFFSSCHLELDIIKIVKFLLVILTNNMQKIEYFQKIKL